MLAVGRRARRLAVREAQLETDVARARLEALRLEIQPHFLFNTLNSIAALIRIRANDQALKMLLGLSELMRGDRSIARRRRSRRGRSSSTSPSGYIELQQVRFGDRLDVAYAIEPAAEACLVPAFLLQPIVENAFRHGIGAKAGRCRLELGAAMIGGRLRVTRARRRRRRAGRLRSRAATPAPASRTSARACRTSTAARPRSSVGRGAGGGTIVTLDLPPEPPADLARASA